MFGVAEIAADAELVVAVVVFGHLAVIGLGVAVVVVDLVDPVEVRFVERVAVAVVD